jgi:hypothetical protein
MISIDERDEIYATDISAHTVTRWTLDGKLLQKYIRTGLPGRVLLVQRVRLRLGLEVSRQRIAHDDVLQILGEDWCGHAVACRVVGHAYAPRDSIVAG